MEIAKEIVGFIEKEYGYWDDDIGETSIDIPVNRLEAIIAGKLRPVRNVLVNALNEWENCDKIASMVDVLAMLEEK